MDKFFDFCKEHKWAVICGSLGLLFAILFMTIGFWRTLLVVILVGACFLLGYLLDKGGIDAVTEFFKKLFAKDKNA